MTKTAVLIDDDQDDLDLLKEAINELGQFYRFHKFSKRRRGLD